jgi:hypothetical protein
MCILCGEFVTRIHWTEKHAEDRARASTVAGAKDESRRNRRRERTRRAAVTNQVLRHYGLNVSDWSGTKYILRDGKGRSELVQDLGSLWPVAQKLTGRPLDPLDPALHAALREAPAISSIANGE